VQRFEIGETRDGAVIGVAHVEDMRVPVVIHVDGTVMCSADWQDRKWTPAEVVADMRTHERDGVAEINWLLAASGQSAIMFDGLPRLFP
jgi:hypothetical protein